MSEGRGVWAIVVLPGKSTTMRQPAQSSMRMAPPCSSTISLTMASPSPAPPESAARPGWRGE
ncbi:hypothetical protein AB0K18_49375, partial [Nonomuraea sp. NPDC049421]|uniref:hypothetical protein n=1 Tax=Nonomuraea sp. NPDC049421 TaxID=3155275 RepID=UPI00342DFE2B